MNTYVTKTEPVPNAPGTWDSLRVSIFRVVDGVEEKIGEYLRNYSSLFSTFHPFVQNGREFALYSRDYAATRIMSLPDCTDLGGEDRAGNGFCPTGYFVPPATAFASRPLRRTPLPRVSSKRSMRRCSRWPRSAGWWDSRRALRRRPW